jgi:uncharacterized protein (TIGR02284 family)
MGYEKRGMTMNSHTEATYDAVRDLVSINRDAAKGFKTAADSIEDPAVSRMFLRQSSEREAFAQDLLGLAGSKRSEVDKDGTVTGTMHRWWLDLKGTMSSDSLQSVLEEAERGEEKALEAHREAATTLAGSPFEPPVVQQCHRISSVLSEIRSMKASAPFKK